jgi:hypothetical protein
MSLDLILLPSKVHVHYLLGITDKSRVLSFAPPAELACGRTFLTDGYYKRHRMTLAVTNTYRPGH